MLIAHHVLYYLNIISANVTIIILLSFVGLPYPAPRSGHRIIVYKGNVFAFGGYTPRNPETNELIQPLTNRHLFKEVSILDILFFGIFTLLNLLIGLSLEVL